MSSPWVQVLIGGAIVSAMMTILWLIQRMRHDAGIVDVGWCLGLAILAPFYAFLGGGDPNRRLLVAMMGAIWALRLAIYILLNRVIGKPEDGRYQTLRKKWGEQAQAKFFLFFQFQAALDLIFAIPFLVVAASDVPLWRVVDVAGAAIWLIAVIGETTADLQLAAHRADPAQRGRTCRRGLWRYSRHPNYFFEWIHWWSYVLLAVGSPAFVLTWIAPALMLFFLFKVTGIPATERQALASRGDDYRQYQETTSAFIPWFPKSSAGFSTSVQRQPPPR
jgi:steroid 5-alpha reductase family enzyme